MYVFNKYLFNDYMLNELKKEKEGRLQKTEVVKLQMLRMPSVGHTYSFSSFLPVWGRCVNF